MHERVVRNTFRRWAFPLLFSADLVPNTSVFAQLEHVFMPLRARCRAAHGFRNVELSMNPIPK